MKNPRPIPFRQFTAYLKSKYGLKMVNLYIRDPEPWHPVRTLYLSEIRVFSKDRGKGIGSNVMEEIVGYADQNKLPITLIPIADEGDVDRLRLWYEKFGFEDWYREGQYSEEDLEREYTKYMIRYPRSIPQKNPRRRRNSQIKRTTRKVDDISRVIYSIGDGGHWDQSRIELMLNSPWTYPKGKYHSVFEFFVPEEKRGQGDARRLMARMLSEYGDHPISAQVSSAPSLVLFYRNGFKVSEKPTASLEEALKMLEESGYSLNMRNVLSNPRRRRNGTRLVPKEQVRMVGFGKVDTATVEPEIPYVLSYIEELEGRSLLFPTPIRPMTKAEIRDGRRTIDSGHPNGAGHGQYDSGKCEVSINKSMEPLDLIANVFHENLHHARPDLSEEVVRDTTGVAMEDLYGVHTLGRPYAKNSRRKR